MGKGVLFHCYSGALGDMEEILSLGGYLSIPGVVTWPRSQKLHEVATRVPSDRFLVETDAPYLSPEPWRGHRNRPALILYTIHAIARLRGASAEWVAARTAENAVRFFGLDRPR
jgi:TatD DNase family protein